VPFALPTFWAHRQLASNPETALDEMRAQATFGWNPTHIGWRHATGFQAFGVLAQLWIPVTWTLDMPRTDQDFALLTRLKPGVAVETGSAQLDVVFKRLATRHPSDFPN
jgi:hypothetical protein